MCCRQGRLDTTDNNLLSSSLYPCTVLPCHQLAPSAVLTRCLLRRHICCLVALLILRLRLAAASSVKWHRAAAGNGLRPVRLLGGCGQCSQQQQQPAKQLAAASELHERSIWLPAAVGSLLLLMREHPLYSRIADTRQLLDTLGQLLQEVRCSGIDGMVCRDGCRCTCSLVIQEACLLKVAYARHPTQTHLAWFGMLAEQAAAQYCD